MGKGELVKRAFALLLFIVVLVMCFPVTAYADSGSGIIFDNEDLENELATGTDAVYSDILAILSDFIAASNPVEEIAEMPAIHIAMEEVAAIGISPMSIITQPNYPYTGGAFVALNTNYGTGLACFPEQFKINTFGFRRNTDRVVNLTNATINGYWIMGGVTYNLRVQRYGELEYQFTTTGTAQWRTLTVSAMTDSNIQFLDETGERGIQRPHISLETRIIIAFIFIEIAIHSISLIRGR